MKGFYYRAALPKATGGSTAGVHPSIQPASAVRSTDPLVPQDTVGQMGEIQSASVDQLCDSSSEALLQEIRSRHARLVLWPWGAGLCIIGLLIANANQMPPWLLGMGAIAAVAVTLLTYRSDVARKLTIVHYSLDTPVQEAFTRLTEAAKAIAGSTRMWHVKGSAQVLDKKYHAGASETISRAAASISRSLPSLFACNVDPVAIKLSKVTLYFFPDRVLVYEGSRVGAAAYKDIRCELSDVNFAETGPVPPEAEVIKKTWRYVNKKGGPDKRFANNPEIPVCRYQEFFLKTDSGINEVIQYSKYGAGIGFPVGLQSLAALA